MPPDKKHTKKTAGRLGGLATLEKYGREHFQDIGAQGAQTTWTRYIKMPYGQTQYCLIDRETGKIVKILDQ